MKCIGATSAISSNPPGLLVFVYGLGGLTSLVAFVLVLVDLVVLVFDFLVVGGALIIFAKLGVADVVQNHLPSASDQDSPSLALLYGAIDEILFPIGSNSFACPAVLLKLNPVFDE